MTVNPPFWLIEPGLGEWRRARIDADGLPSGLDLLGDHVADATGALFHARITRLDRQNDLAFLDLGDGASGVMNQRRARLLRKGRSFSISDSVTEGETLTVQVVHDGQGGEDKALSVTPKPRLAGRYVTVEAGGARLNFSKDLSPATVRRLDEAMAGLGDHAAIVVRSRAALADPDVVAEEAGMLVAALTRPYVRPGLVFARHPLDQSLLDIAPGDDPVLVEGGGALADAKEFAYRHYPDLADRLALARFDGPAMEACGVEEAVEEALADRIELPSGGWISVHPTPALTAIDVNMGRAWRADDAAEAKLRVNEEAAEAVAWHLAFQNIGGLIVVDFIDMSGKGRTEALMTRLKAALARDPVPVQCSGLSGFGLVQINRPRRGLSLRERLLQPRAPGARPKAEAARLLRQARLMAERAEHGTLVFTAGQAVRHCLESRRDMLAGLGEESGRRVVIEDGPPAVRLREET